MSSLSLYEDLLGPGESLPLPAGSRVVYVASGAASDLRAGEAWAGGEAVTLEAGDEGATILRWELTDWAVADAKLSVDLELDPWVEYVLRCERLDGVAGGAGRGISCLLKGELLVDGTSVGALGAWREPALIEAAGGRPAVVRVTLVPADDGPGPASVLAEAPASL